MVRWSVLLAGIAASLLPSAVAAAMDESELRSLYQYIKSLGEAGERAPDAVGPGEEPKTPYFLLQPTPPKG
jgi:hypothetical protein